jgi:hypothetical protein
LVSDIPAGDGKIVKLFLQCRLLERGVKKIRKIRLANEGSQIQLVCYTQHPLITKLACSYCNYLLIGRMSSMPGPCQHFSDENMSQGEYSVATAEGT